MIDTAPLSLELKTLSPGAIKNINHSRGGPGSGPMYGVLSIKIMEKRIRIYQSFYDAHHVRQLDSSFVPYDVSESPFPDLYEIYWLIRLHGSAVFEENDYCGLVSWKFGMKTRLKGRHLIDFINRNPGYDVYFINPYPYLAYRFFNVWEQGEKSHRGITNLAQLLMNEVSYDVSINNMGRNGRDNLLYCNFWAGNKKFWDAYIGFIKPLYDHCVTGEFSGSQNPFFSATRHYGKEAPFFPFIFERLFSTFLIHDQSFNLCPYMHTRDEILNACKHERDREIVDSLGARIDELDREMENVEFSLQRRMFRELHSGWNERAMALSSSGTDDS